jgi:hypothetical protein
MLTIRFDDLEAAELMITSTSTNPQAPVKVDYAPMFRFPPGSIVDEF